MANRLLYGEMMGFFGDWLSHSIEIIISPRQFFEKMPKEGSYIEVIKFATLNLLIYLIFRIASLFAFNPSRFSEIFHIDATIYAAIFIAVFLAFEITIMAISSGIYHFLLRFGGAKYGYNATFRTLAYSSVFFLFMWIPIIGFFVQLYILYILVTALSEVHEINLEDAAIPLIVIVIMNISFFVIRTIIFQF